MNVPLTTSTNTGKLNFFTKVKRCFSYKKFNLRTLIKDVFEKSKPTTNQGSKMTEKKVCTEKLPNSISAKDEKFGIGGGSKIKLYQEDLDKMKDMSIDEKLKYTEHLIENGKYYQ